MVDEQKRDAAAVVVHYKSPDTLATTLEDLRHDFMRDEIFVVDNSDDLDETWDLRAVIVRPRENLGYARAVNEGIRRALTRDPHLVEIMVSTHETRFEKGVIQQLLDVASGYPAGHLVAPRLVTRDPETGQRGIWSEGGRLSLPFRYPQHIRSGGNQGVRGVLWVDGAAFVIAVNSWRAVGGIPEEFFLYMEDVALGIACKKASIPVLVVLDASVEQSANGPSRYLAIRNRLILARGYLSRLDRAVVYAEVYARALIFGAGFGVNARPRASESWRAIRDAAGRSR